MYIFEESGENYILQDNVVQKRAQANKKIKQFGKRKRKRKC
jgi:hypothetical protein